MEGNGMMTPMTPRDVCQTCCDSCPRSISFQDPWMARYCFRIVTWSFSEEKWSTNRRIWMDLGYVPLFFSGSYRQMIIYFIYTIIFMQLLAVFYCFSTNKNWCPKPVSFSAEVCGLLQQHSEGQGGGDSCDGGETLGDFTYGELSMVIISG